MSEYRLRTPDGRYRADNMGTSWSRERGAVTFVDPPAEDPPDAPVPIDPPFIGVIPELRKLIDIWELEAENGSTLQSRAAYRACASMLRHVMEGPR